VSRLMCESCGLSYSRAAIVRQMALATGVACRRCGGTLKAEEAPAHGLERLSSGWRLVDADGGADGERPSARGSQR
jgi:predicted nucleic acid-binding Zn ribbon protein